MYLNIYFFFCFVYFYMNAMYARIFNWSILLFNVIKCLKWFDGYHENAVLRWYFDYPSTPIMAYSVNL